METKTIIKNVAITAVTAAISITGTLTLTDQDINKPVSELRYEKTADPTKILVHRTQTFTYELPIASIQADLQAITDRLNSYPVDGDAKNREFLEKLKEDYEEHLLVAQEFNKQQ